MNKNFKQAIHIIVNTLDPDKIILFGSRAKGKGNKESDYDILIIKTGITNKRKWIQDLYRNLLGLHLAIDILIETPEEFTENKQNPFLIYHSIDKEGNIIYERK